MQLQDYTTPGVYENFLRRFDLKGRLKKSYALTNLTSCCVNSGATFGMGQDGRVVAIWNEWQLMAQRFAPSGAPRGEKFLIGKDLEDDPFQSDPAIAVADETFVVIWGEENRDGDGGGIFGRVFSATGTPLSNDLQINTTSEGWQYQPAIATAPGGPVVAVWVTYGGDVFARRLTSEP